MQLIVSKRPQLHVLLLDAARATAADTGHAGVPSKGSRGVDEERVRCLQLQVLDGTMTMAQYINATSCGGCHGTATHSVMRYLGVHHAACRHHRKEMFERISGISAVMPHHVAPHYMRVSWPQIESLVRQRRVRGGCMSVSSIGAVCQGQL